MYKPALLLLAVAFFFGVSVTQSYLNQTRKEMDLTRLAPLEDAPPVLAFTTQALGGFRGLIANALWMRLTTLQQEGRFFEIVQLADWITKLQPFQEAIWVHHAWNMSYNISVKFEKPEARWRWVQRGIELLRDQGLKYNPQETLIYRELAWHFQHKLGDNLDNAHWHYKRQWANKMKPFLDDEGYPKYDALLSPEGEDQKKLAQKLKEEYKLQPKEMREVDKTYGPFDWRLPEAHAIYWAMLGLEDAKEENRIRLRRVIYQSMQRAFQRGRWIEVAGTDRFDLGPNLEIVGKVNKAYENMMEQQPERRDHIAIGHKNFLKNAAYLLYTHNRLKEAAKWFADLKESYPDEISEGKSLSRFVVDRATELYGGTNRDQIIGAIQGLLSRSFYSLAVGEYERSSGYELLARKVHKRYQGEIGEIESAKQRVGLKPFKTIKKEVLARILNSETPRFNSVMKQRLRTELELPEDWSGAGPSQPSEESSSAPERSTGTGG